MEEHKKLDVDGLYAEFSKELNELATINERVKKKIRPHIKKIVADRNNYKLKGGEVVGWLGELYAATVLDGEIVSDDKSYDVVVAASKERVEVKTRRQPNDKSTSWKRSGVISVDEDDPPTHLVFVKLNKGYQLEKTYKFKFTELKELGRLKLAKSNGNQRGYYFTLAPSRQSQWIIYPKKGTKWSEEE